MKENYVINSPERNCFIKVLKENRIYGERFNISHAYVVFPSSFGIIPFEDKWLFYELDERLVEYKKVFLSENDAYRYAIRRYNLKVPVEQIGNRSISNFNQRKHKRPVEQFEKIQGDRYAKRAAKRSVRCRSSRGDELVALSRYGDWDRTTTIKRKERDNSSRRMVRKKMK